MPFALWVSGSVGTVIGAIPVTEEIHKEIRQEDQSLICSYDNNFGLLLLTAQNHLLNMLARKAI